MKIGVCASVDKLPMIRELGYDYIEMSFSRLASLDDAALREQTAIVERNDACAEVFNLFFGQGAVLYSSGEEHDMLLRELEKYAAGGFARASAWGGRLAVIGSGRARGIPDGMDRAQALAQLSRVISVCAEQADKVGMLLTVEPLCRDECNFINTVSEGAALAGMTEGVNVGVTVDFYHCRKERDPLDALHLHAERIWHAHYAQPWDRKVPGWRARRHLRACAEALGKCPNASRISLECRLGENIERELERAAAEMAVFRGI